MYLSRTFRILQSILGGLVVALASASIAVGPAVAGPPQPPRLPPGAKGYEMLMAQQKYLQDLARWQARGPRSSDRPTVTVRGTDGRQRAYQLDGQITQVEQPGSSDKTTVTIRKSDGRVRTFELEGQIIRVQPPSAVVRQK